MTVSDNIRALAHEGLGVAEIARRLGIRYQHAYNVLKAGGLLASTNRATATADGARHGSRLAKPTLAVSELIKAGFVLSTRWLLSERGDLTTDQPIPKPVGVYAFAKDGIVLYVGLATKGLAKRLHFYARPGITQRTSRRLNGLIKNELSKGASIEIYTAIPPDLEWNSLPIHGGAGLELGLIRKFVLPWNMRSAG